ncbi:MAG: ABC transporter permease [Candidatus Doudnabacteria bacterium]|nr:ABC transporter permease [Candidatus Doudnabacteria bacterium]
MANIKMFVRNRQALYFTFFFPIFLMVVLGLINFDRTAKVDVGIVFNSPPTAQTKQFVEAIKKVELFNVHEDTEINERQALVDDKRAVVFVIPPDLIPGPATINAIVNADQGPGAGTATNIISGMLDKTALQLSGASNQFVLNREEVNSKHLKYIDYLLPGLIGLSVMQLAIFSVAFVFVMFKEKGILKRLVATPMRPWAFVLSNVITRLVVTLLQTATFIIIAVVFFDVQVFGSYWLIALIALFGAVMFLGIGFTISGLASTVESVPVFANLVAFPMMFLGGTFFPIDSFPNWLQSFAKYLPLTFFSDSLRSVMTKGSTFSDISRDLVWMGIWCVITIILANVTFGFEEKRQ